MQHEQFAREYLKDFNATASGKRCGYSETYGRDLLRNPSVKNRISELRDELTEATEITGERIARAHAEIAFYDARDIARVLDAFSDPSTSLAERLDELPRRVTAPIRKMTKRVDNKGVTYTVEAYDRHRSLEVLRDRYWSPDESDERFIQAIRSLRDDAVPDMSEDNTPHAQDDATHVDLDAIPDTTATPDDPTPPRWRKGRKA